MRFPEEYAEYFRYTGFCKMCGSDSVWVEDGLLCEQCFNEWVAWSAAKHSAPLDGDHVMEFLYAKQAEGIKQYYELRQALVEEWLTRQPLKLKTAGSTPVERT